MSDHELEPDEQPPSDGDREGGDELGSRREPDPGWARGGEADREGQPRSHEAEFEDEDQDDEYEELDEDEDDAHAEPEVTIEVSGLSLYTHMGVTAAEREIGQRLLVDVRLDVGDTVDYGQVCELINLVAQQREYRTLERFCAAVADRLIERYELQSVWVKAAKPEPPIALVVGEVSVEVWREA
jgi:dihydroneopterin aldolase